MLLRPAAGRKDQPSATILESQTRPSSPDSSQRAGDDGAKRTRGCKGPLAVDTLGHLLAWRVTAANEQERAQGVLWAAQGPEVTGAAVAVACVDQGSPGDQPPQAAAAHSVQREVVKRPEAKNGFV